MIYSIGKNAIIFLWIELIWLKNKGL